MADERSDAGLRGRDLIGLGGLLAGAVIAGTVLGVVLDGAFDTSPVLTVVGAAVGIAVACPGFWFRVRAALRE